MLGPVRKKIVGPTHSIKMKDQMTLMIMIVTDGWGLQQWPTSPITIKQKIQ